MATRSTGASLECDDIENRRDHSRCPVSYWNARVTASVVPEPAVVSLEPVATIIESFVVASIETAWSLPCAGPSNRRDQIFLPVYASSIIVTMSACVVSPTLVPTTQIQYGVEGSTAIPATVSSLAAGPA